MDELEFRRRLLSDPNDRSEDIQHYIQQTPNRRRYVEQLHQLDESISEAMNIEVPDDLADRILFSHSKPKAHITLTRKAMAIAASVLFVGGLLLGQINWGHVVVSPAYANLDKIAVEHIKHEAPFIKYVNEGVKCNEFNNKLRAYSYQLNQDFPYHVYYLNHCGFDKNNHALHLVFASEHDKYHRIYLQYCRTRLNRHPSRWFGW